MAHGHLIFENFKKSLIKEYYGRRAAGILAIAQSTGKILLSFRSPHVDNGNNWSNIGGAANIIDDDYFEVAKREFYEETGYSGTIQLIPVYVFRDEKEDFEYHNFLGIIPEEFEPRAKKDFEWENLKYRWFTLNQIIKLPNKHPGLSELLEDKRTMDILRKYTTIQNDVKKYLDEAIETSNLAACVLKTKTALRLVLYDVQNFVNLYQHIEDKGANPLIKEGMIIGTVAAELPRTNCMKAYTIFSSMLYPKYRGKGYGKLLYSLLMTAIYPAALTADRGLVSVDADNLWKSLQANSKVEKLPPSQEPYRKDGQFDNPAQPETEPREDDCILHNREKPELNKAYRYTSAQDKQQLEVMLSNHENVKKKLNIPNDELFSKFGQMLFTIFYDQD